MGLPLEGAVDECAGIAGRLRHPAHALTRISDLTGELSVKMGSLAPLRCIFHVGAVCAMGMNVARKRCRVYRHDRVTCPS